MPVPDYRKILGGIWDSPDPSTLEKLRQARFVAHNIPLTRELSTLPDEKLLSDSPRTIAIHDALYRFLGPELKHKAALDLGCLEGGHSFELLCAGMNVLGVEGRAENYARCLLIKEYYQSIGSIDFLQEDVRQFEPPNTFDFVLCSGLLYHLEDPAAFIEKLGTLTSPDGVLFLDTHVMPEDYCLEQSVFRSDLSEIRNANTGSRRLRYREYHEASLSHPESAIGNRYSVWMDTRSHLELLFDAGFGRVYEPHGFYGTEEQDLKERYSRRCFVGLKTAEQH